MGILLLTSKEVERNHEGLICTPTCVLLHTKFAAGRTVFQLFLLLNLGFLLLESLHEHKVCYMQFVYTHAKCMQGKKDSLSYFI